KGWIADHVRPVDAGEVTHRARRQDAHHQGPPRLPGYDRIRLPAADDITDHTLFQEALVSPKRQLIDGAHDKPLRDVALIESAVLPPAQPADAEISAGTIACIARSGVIDQLRRGVGDHRGQA